MQNETDFQLTTFRTLTGGTPKGVELVGLQDVLRVPGRHTSPRNGREFSWTGEKVCRPTGESKVRQSFNGDIDLKQYETPDGGKFWRGYGEGTPKHYNSGVFEL